MRPERTWSIWKPRWTSWRARKLRTNKPAVDRKSTRLNSSHLVISYAVFCLKKKKKTRHFWHTLHSLTIPNPSRSFGTSPQPPSLHRDAPNVPTPPLQHHPLTCYTPTHQRL